MSINLKVTNKTAAVIIPSGEVWNDIQPLRRKYLSEITFRRWMPHITLFFPFFHKDHLQYVAEHLGTRISSHKKFHITLNKFQYFEKSEHDYVLWLAPEPSDEIITLFNSLKLALSEIAPEYRFRANFVPHLTVGRISDRDTLNNILRELNNYWHSVSFRLQGISFIWSNDPADDIFHTHTEINFN